MRHLSLLLVLTAACRCDRQDPNAAPGRVSWDGVTRNVFLFLEGADRLKAWDVLPLLSEGQAGLVGYSRDRFIHLYGTDPAGDVDVLFLDEKGALLERVRLETAAQTKGITSSLPSRYALLVRPGTPFAKSSRVEFIGAASAHPDPLPALTLGGQPFHLEFALSEKEKNRGLMHRPRLSPDEGMLFVYKRDQHHGFWMRNTWVPLDIAFLNHDGTVVNVKETPVWNDPVSGNGPHARSLKACRYVLELPMGTFRRLGLLDTSGKVKPGTRALLPPALP